MSDSGSPARAWLTATEGGERLHMADVSVPRIPKTLEPEAWEWMIGTSLPPQGPSTPAWHETHVRLRLALPCPATLPPDRLQGWETHRKESDLHWAIPAPGGRQTQRTALSHLPTPPWETGGFPLRVYSSLPPRPCHPPPGPDFESGCLKGEDS